MPREFRTLTLLSKSYTHHVKGICSVSGCSPARNMVADYLKLLQHMQTSTSASKLATLFDPDQPLPTDDKRLVVAYLSTTEDDLHQMRPSLISRSSANNSRPGRDRIPPSKLS